MTPDKAVTPDKTQRRQDLAGFEKKATRVSIGLLVAGFVLGFAAILLGSAEVFPSEYTLTVSLIAMLGPIGLALLIGAVGGLYIMGGWKLAPFGILFVAAFAALVYGIGTPDAFWRLITLAVRRAVSLASGGPAAGGVHRI